MASSVEEIMISYEELSDLENEFDEVETEISEFKPSKETSNLSPRNC